jgi:hypothetical protein
MARRTKDWNKGLAEDLRNREFSREFLMAAIEVLYKKRSHELLAANPTHPRHTEALK